MQIDDCRCMCGAHPPLYVRIPPTSGVGPWSPWGGMRAGGCGRAPAAAAASACCPPLAAPEHLKERERGNGHMRDLASRQPALSAPLIRTLICEWSKASALGVQGGHHTHSGHRSVRPGPAAPGASRTGCRPPSGPVHHSGLPAAGRILRPPSGCPRPVPRLCGQPVLTSTGA